MKHDVAVVVSLVIMIGLIVGLDVAYLRHRFALRLVVNASIVAVVGALYILVSRLL